MGDGDVQAASSESIAHDIAAINRIEAVPTILKTVTHVTGMRFAAVARVTESNWTACAVYDDIQFGLQPGGELALEATFCNEIRQSGKPVVFSQASTDPVFASHPLPPLYGFESYISVPIVRGDGRFFGTLCALDPLPAKLDDPHVLQTLELFAQLIAAQLDADDRLVRSDAQLSASHDLGKLREQFIAVLGHDLRNPLQAISMAAEMLLLDPLPAPAERNVRRIQGSVERMSDLVNDILDFARGRLGGGIPVALHAHDDLAAELEEVVTENRGAHPEREIHARFDLDSAVICDCSRLAQLLDNLLANALRHGAEDQPVRVDARCGKGIFELSVHNAGPAIAPGKRARLFQPFSRTLSDEPGPGLGLGLFIAAEIAKAHLGTLTVTSTETDGTRFVFSMPAT
ncbi:MAG: GAF domain-containing sensor histidine kinase [Pseudoxanthomonas sp.]